MVLDEEGESGGSPVASLLLTRGEGKFGVIRVPFSITDVADPSRAVDDIVPAEGFVVFQSKAPYVVVSCVERDTLNGRWMDVLRAADSR